MWLIDYCHTHHNKVVSVVSETRPHLAKGSSRDFIKIMQVLNYFKDDRWNKTELIYTFETDTKLEFFSADQPGKVRGPRRDVLFINEANNVPYEIYTQLEIRTKDIVFIDSNPTSEYWAYTELLATQDIDFITLTYKDNEALSQNIIDSLESRKNNKNWWQVYGLGQLGLVEGAIYPHFKPIDSIPEEARLVRKGLDFGYTNDPSALLDIWQWNNAFIWDELLYRKGLSNKDIADVILNSEKALVVADSAEPKSIDELTTYGVNVIASQKGQGSVLQGIQYVQDQVIYVTKRSLNIWKEQRNYLWLTDKDGKIINEPSPFLNHLMDAGRYGMESLRPYDAIGVSIAKRNNLKSRQAWSIG